MKYPLVILIVVLSTQLNAQNKTSSLLEIGAKQYELQQYDSAIESFYQVIYLDSTIVDAYTFLGYIWINKMNFDSAIVYLNKSIELDSTNGEVFFARGFAKYGYFNLTYGDACDDFRMAKELGYSDTAMESIYNEKCWKHDHVLIKGDGLVDSTMIDKVNELLPPSWEIFQFQDRITLDDGDYYFILINNQFSFIDSIYSTADKLKPEITVAIFDKKYERKLKMDLKNKLKNLKDDHILETEILKGNNCIIAFNFNMEFWIERSVTDAKLKEQYYADKNTIIKNIKKYRWKN